MRCLQSVPAPQAAQHCLPLIGSGMLATYAILPPVSRDTLCADNKRLHLRQSRKGGRWAFSGPHAQPHHQCHVEVAL